ncbi:Cytochrome c domain-containing protein [Planctomycetales bacterium 10988]|nr:Cytochrome c domain-containing protein [Planctomycetales bacterium 10988]
MILSVRTSLVALLLAMLPASLLAQMGPEEELQTLQVPEGFDISLFAAEPMVTNPAAIDVDTHGRVWVAEIQNYRQESSTDKIKVLEDTDGDGKADKVTVFTDEVFCPMSICVAGDKVYIVTSPDLWVFEDKDGDLKADGPPTKLLTGFGGFNHDHGSHSLVLGPDHKWYMAQGDRGYDVEGTDGSHIQYTYGAMLRGELDGSKLETVAKNFRNPYEIALSSFGEMYCSDNDNDGNRSVRICWLLEGGDYGWFGGPPFLYQDLDYRLAPDVAYREAFHFRGHLPGYVPGTLVTGFGSPCGMLYYEGDAFPESYQNAPWHCDSGPRQTRIYRHQAEGFGMTAESEVMVSTDGDSYHRPVDVCTAPDGSVFLADWYDGGVGGHAYDDPERGRIFLLTPSGKSLQAVAPAGPYDSIETALEGLKSPNLATQFLARERLLEEGEASIEPLKELAASAEPKIRARAYWVLDRIGGEGREVVLDLLKGEDAKFRELAVRILRAYGDEYEDEILALSGDESPQVRREVLLSIAKFSSDKAFETLLEMAKQYDGEDRYQLESIHIAAQGREEKLYQALADADAWNAENLLLMQALQPNKTADYLITQLQKPEIKAEEISRLLSALALIPEPEAGMRLLELAAKSDLPLKVRQQMLDLFAGKLVGDWESLTKENEALDLIEGLLVDSDLKRRALQIIEQQTLRRNSIFEQVQALAEDDSAETDLREKAIEVAGVLKPGSAAAFLRTLLESSNEEVAQASLEALIEMQNIPTLQDILTGKRYSDDVRHRVVREMMSSTNGSLILYRMVKEDELASNLKEQTMKLGLDHPEPKIRYMFEEFLPEEERSTQLGGQINPEEILALSGDAERGKRIFFESSTAQCANCHMVQGRGKALGPDLSLVGKKFAREALLEAVLDPSKAVAPEYYAYMMLTDLGMVHAGFLVEQSEEQTVLKDIQGKLIQVPTDEVEEIFKQDKSLMPEQLLKDLTAEDAADLLAFLTSLTEGIQTVTRFRIAGSFPNRGGNGLRLPAAPEENLANPDLSQQFPVNRVKKMGWDVVLTDMSRGVATTDVLAYDRANGLRDQRVVHYLLTFAESPIDQEAALQITCDEGVRAFVNGEEVLFDDTAGTRGELRTLEVRAPFKAGRNAIVLKVINDEDQGPVGLAIGCETPVKLTLE